MNDTTLELRSVDVGDLKRKASEIGFDLCGVAAAEQYPELSTFRSWLDHGYAGEMHYLERSADRRMDVRTILPSVRSVIVLGTLYNSARPYSTEVADPSRAAIARYAWGDDYHVIIQRRMDVLVEWLRSVAGPGLQARAYVDTGPVQERVFAQYAGLGWIGKNTCLINADYGSWLFLSEIICNVPLPVDEAAMDRCGTCTLCLDACPTGALVEPGTLDSRRCISYLTIELRGPVPEEHRPAIGNHAYGCDICQEVCPWNLTPLTRTSSDSAWQPREGLDAPTLVELWRRSDEELRLLLKGSAMKRAGVKRLRRNLATAIANSGDATAIAALSRDSEPTALDSLVQAHVDWANCKSGI